MIEKIKRKNNFSGILGLVIISILLEFIILMIVGLIVYLFNSKEFNLELYLSGAKQLSIFWILKMIFMIYPIALFFVFRLQAYRKNNSYYIAGKALLIYLVFSVLAFILFPDTQWFLELKTQRFGTGFFYYTIISTFVSVFYTNKYFNTPPAVARS